MAPYPVAYPQNIIAIDTSSTNLSLALMTNSEIICAITDTSGLPHSLKLFPLIENTLAELGLTLSDFDLLAVNTGPGSFTGLRVGLAAAQALAWVSGKPLVGINAMDALTYFLGMVDLPVGILLHSGRNDVFWGERKLQRDFSIIGIGRDRVFSLAQVPTVLLANFSHQYMYFIGDAASTLWDELSTNQNWKLAATPSSLAPIIATVSSRHLFREVPPKVEAYYLRLSEAEVNNPR